jgi:type II secretory pathway component PulJ
MIVAATLTVLVAGATVAILRSMVAVRRRVDRQMALQQEARAAVTAIASALRNAYRGGGDQAVLEGIDGWQGHRPADRIRFFTVSRQTVRPGQPESDVKECEFALSEPSDESPPALMRRTDPTWNEQPDGGGVVERVAEGVLGLDLAYHDGTEWRGKWPKGKRGWPLAVRIRLAVLARTRPREVYTTSRVVNFPRRAAPQERKKP